MKYSAFNVSRNNWCVDSGGARWPEKTYLLLDTDDPMDAVTATFADRLAYWDPVGEDWEYDESAEESAIFGVDAEGEEYIIDEAPPEEPSEYPYRKDDERAAPLGTVR